MMSTLVQKLRNHYIQSGKGDASIILKKYPKSGNNRNNIRLHNMNKVSRGPKDMWLSLSNHKMSSKSGLTVKDKLKIINYVT